MYEKPMLVRFGTLRDLTEIGLESGTSDLLFLGTASASGPSGPTRS